MATNRRNMMSRILKQEIDNEAAAAEVAKADSWVDEANHVLEEEEPRLATWLTTDQDLIRAVMANQSAVYWALIHGSHRGQPFDHVMEHVVQPLMEGLMEAVAMRAVQSDRQGRSTG